MKNIPNRVLMIAVAVSFTFISSKSLAHNRHCEIPKVKDRLEDKRDRKEDIRDRREDVLDALHHGGLKDKLEDIRDKREDVLDRREDRRDRRH